MINITIPRVLGGFNNDTEKFVDLPAITLPPLEHSLIAVSKWEAKYQVPFLKNIQALAQPNHHDKFLYYINCMSTKGEISPETLKQLTADNILEITKYIGDPHSATLPSGSGVGGKGNNKPATAERIYASMVGYRIPAEYARWHLNNLLMLLDVCYENNQDPADKKKGDPTAAMAFYEQNEALRRQGKKL